MKRVYYATIVTRSPLLTEAEILGARWPGRVSNACMVIAGYIGVWVLLPAVLRGLA